jgi:hypothetical protein
MVQFIVTSLEWKLVGLAKLSCIAGMVLLRKNHEITFFNNFLRVACRVAASSNMAFQRAAKSAASRHFWLPAELERYAAPLLFLNDGSNGSIKKRVSGNQLNKNSRTLGRTFSMSSLTFAFSFDYN